tara:strand:- start:12742 stop:13026 length:285 start_codon:yes stop_codon:yes gene_type:complete
MSIQFATQRLLDSVWTLAYKWRDGKVEIVAYDREEAVGYKYEYDLPQCKLIEQDDRTVTHVRLRKHRSFDYCWGEDAGETFEVVNPAHVFSYSK